LGVDAAGRDECVDGAVFDADVGSEFDVGDAFFGDEPADETGFGGEPFGGFVDGQQGHGGSFRLAVGITGRQW
jgi:hypothetical protein